MDYHYDFSPRELQQSFLAEQLEIAVRRNLPVVLHMRESTDDTFSIVEKATVKHPNWRDAGKEPMRGVFHCFPGTAEQASYVHKLGFCISYPGILTFKKSDSIEVVKRVGINNLLLETDSPFMAPVPLRGKRNEPANVVYIAKKIAEALVISEEEVARITTENAIRLFGL